MFSLFGPEESLKNIYKLSHRYFDGTTVTNTDALRNYYLDFLAAHQPKMPVNRGAERIITDPQVALQLKEVYRASALNDLNQQDILGQPIEGEELASLVKLVKQGYAYLGSQNPKLKVLLDLCIHSIFFVKSNKGQLGGWSFGGSSSTAMGAIWISGHKQLTPLDIAEFLVHELTHHLLFIAERCEAQFHYKEMVLPENFAQSAILHRRRPLDKVVHSIAVSTEILLARSRFLPPDGVVIHPSTEVLTKQTEAAINDVLRLKRLNQVLTPWTLSLINACQTAISKTEAIAC